MLYRLLVIIALVLKPSVSVKDNRARITIIVVTEVIFEIYSIFELRSRSTTLSISTSAGRNHKISELKTTTPNLMFRW